MSNNEVLPSVRGCWRVEKSVVDLSLRLLTRSWLRPATLSSPAADRGRQEGFALWIEMDTGQLGAFVQAVPEA